MNEQKVALITGANKGIGFETARVLAERGYRILLGARDQTRGEEAAGKLRQAGGDIELLLLDVASSASIHEAVPKVEQLTDRLDVLINNAGIYSDEGVSILSVSRQQVIETFETNTFGALEMIQEFAPLLKRTPGARIINVSSGYGALEDLSPNVPSYCLSKLALNGVTLMTAEALKPAGIPVNSVCPGWVRSDMGGAAATRSVKEGADTIVWLATDAPLSITGKFLRDRQEICW